MNDIRFETPGCEQKLDKEWQKVTHIIEPGNELVEHEVQAGNPAYPARRGQFAPHADDIETPVRDMLPGGLVGNVPVQRFAAACYHHGVVVVRVEIAHKVTQANDCATVTDAIFDIKYASSPAHAWVPLPVVCCFIRRNGATQLPGN